MSTPERDGNLPTRQIKLTNRDVDPGSRKRGNVFRRHEKVHVRRGNHLVFYVNSVATRRRYLHRKDTITAVERAPKRRQLLCKRTALWLLCNRWGWWGYWRRRRAWWCGRSGRPRQARFQEVRGRRSCTIERGNALVHKARC